LVVSMTIFPSSGPASCNASGIMPHGTETTTTSPNPAACAGVPAATVVPIDPVSFSSASGWRLSDSISSWLAASWRAIPRPMRPAPMIAIFTLIPPCPSGAG
jgi:hypothetical protein